MSENHNRRLVSGQRIVCKCSLELPKPDPFAPYRKQRSGIMVLNVRGGSLYMPKQFTEQSVEQVFPDSKPGYIKKFILYPATGAEIRLGDIQVRYLKMNKKSKVVGMVLRFVNLSEKQMDILNSLEQHFPLATADEEESFSVDDLYGI